MLNTFWWNLLHSQALSTLYLQASLQYSNSTQHNIRSNIPNIGETIAIIANENEKNRLSLIEKKFHSSTDVENKEKKGDSLLTNKVLSNSIIRLSKL